MPTELSSSSAALLIESDPALAQAFQDLIALAYHSSVTLDVVCSLTEGLTYLQSHHVPVILMDLSLPDSTGRKAVDLVRETAPASALIGFLHRRTDTTMLSDAIRSGAHEVLPVIPPSAETLRLSITSALIRATHLQTATEPPSPKARPIVSLPLAKVAHDLNNCLTSINGFADILLARLSVEDPSLYCAQQIKLACTRADSLIKQLPQITCTSLTPQLSKPTNNAPGT